MYNSGDSISYDRFGEWTAQETGIGPGGGGIFQLGSDSLKMDVYDSKIRVQNNTTDLITGTTDLTTDVWSHVAVSRREGDIRAFLNGIQQGSTVTNSTHDFNSNNLLDIGRNSITSVVTEEAAGGEALAEGDYTKRFVYTGADESWTVPIGVSELTVELWGAAGGGSGAYSLGAPGGYVKGDLTVSGGDELVFVVGQGGYGVGAHAGAGGGGAFIYSTSSDTHSNILAAAGG